MMTDVKWLKTQLQNSLDVLTVVVERIPEERLTEQPPEKLSAWPIQRHVYHLYIYEKLVLPIKRMWLPNSPSVSVEDNIITRQLWAEQDRRWPKKTSAHWLGELTQLRREMIGMLAKYPAGAWDSQQVTIWGEKDLNWVYLKTIQHTIEHTNTIMQLGLFWDEMVAPDD